MIAAATRSDAAEALATARAALTEINMTFGADKSAVFSFAEGFTFLGEEFGPRYPPAVDDRRLIEPPRRCLFLGVQPAFRS